MSRKRSVTDVDDSSSPRKRIRHDSVPFPHTPASFPQTPVPSARSTASSRRPDATPATPYTPYPLRASDSPSNPFGRKRKERLAHSLPPISAFGKHLALCFQLVRRDIPPRMGGVFRTVRVPANYTFTHLRSLITWLFDTPARHAPADDYLFEVKEKVAMYSQLYKPGQIKSGMTKVKISNVRDPGRWPAGYGLDAEEDELLSQETDVEVDERASETEDLMEEEWDWVDEEDFTLGHVWPRGLDPMIGVIYHHSVDTQIHITINATKLPRQRGYSNTPHVFNARGRVHLSPLPLPRPMFTQSVLDTLSSSPAAPIDTKLRTRLMDRMPPPAFSPPKANHLKHAREEDLFDADADGDGDDVHAFTESHPFFQSDASPCKKARHEPSVILVEDSDDEAEDDGSEDFDAQPSLVRWNEPTYAFALYLLQFMDPLGSVNDDIDASFFEAPYDPFDNDDDLVKAVKKTHGSIVYEDEVEYEEDEDVYDEDDDDDDGIDLADSEKDDEAGKDAEYEEEEGEEVDEDGEYEDDEDEDGDYITNPHTFTLGSTPDLVHRSSSSLPASSPPRDSSPPPALPMSEASIVLEEHYPNTKYTQTPAPPRARKHRLRLGRVERRFARTKNAEFLTKYDEVDEEEDPAAAVDELADDGAADVPWTMPVLKEGEVWDPFGDEPEI